MDISNIKTAYPEVSERAFRTQNKYMDFYNYIKNYELRLDEISNRFTIVHKKSKREFTENELIIEMRKANIPFTKEWIKELKSTDVHHFNPIEDYFTNLRNKWNPGDTSHIDMLCDCITAHDLDKRINYQTRKNEIIRKWLYAVVACALKIKHNPVMLIFISEYMQGIGKSWLIEFLTRNLPYLRTTDPKFRKTENLASLTAENFLIIFDELIGLKTEKEVQNVKSILEQKQVVENRRIKTRVASFAGSIDKSDFLIDDAGSRRFAIIQITNIDHSYSERINLDKLFAECVYYITNDANCFVFNSTDFESFQTYNSNFASHRSITYWLKSTFDIATEDDTEAQWLTATEVRDQLCKHGMPEAIRDITSAVKMSKTLIRSGYLHRENVTIRNGYQVNAYLIINKKNI